MYIYKLDDIVNDYNNIYHRTIKMKPIDVKDNTYFDFGKENNDKDPKFQVGIIMLQYQNTNTFLLKDILQISLKKFL